MERTGDSIVFSPVRGPHSCPPPLISDVRPARCEEQAALPHVVRGGADFYDKSVNELAGPSDRVVQLFGGDVPGFGRHVSGGADWDGDGRDDVLVAGDDGRAFVVFGSAAVRTFIRGGLAVSDAPLVSPGSGGY